MDPYDLTDDELEAIRRFWLEDAEFRAVMDEIELDEMREKGTLLHF